MKLRCTAQVANCTLDNILAYFSDETKVMSTDSSFESASKVKDYPCSTSMWHIKIKSSWPVGGRDLLIN